MYQVENVGDHIAALVAHGAVAAALPVALGRSAELAGAAHASMSDSFYLADPRARQAALEVYGV